MPIRKLLPIVAIVLTSAGFTVWPGSLALSRFDPDGSLTILALLTATLILRLHIKAKRT